MTEAQREMARERQRRFAERHPERLREIKAKYRDAHREEHSRRSADRLNAKRRADPEAARARDRAIRLADPDKRRAYEREWSRANPDKVKARTARRRARRWGNGVFPVSEREWRRMVQRYRGCAYCGSLGPLQEEHVIPLARGGRHSIGNIVPACGPCNRRKWQMLIVEWRNGRVLPHPRVALGHPSRAA